MSSSSRKPCADCNRPMFSGAVRCPHCGAFQPRAGAAATPAPSPVRTAAVASAPVAAPAPKTITPVAPQISSEEARALLAVAAVHRGDDVEGPEDEPGVFGGLVLPHPRSTGAVRVLEIVLTLLAVPLIASSLVGLSVLWLRMLRVGGVRARPAMIRVTAMISGLAVLYGVLVLADAPDALTYGLLGVQLAVLVARAALRSYAKSRRRAALDLTR